MSNLLPADSPSLNRDESATISYTGSVLATLTHSKSLEVLTRQISELDLPKFVSVLDFITAEFQQYLRAIDIINDETLELLLDQLLEVFTCKFAQILQVEATAVFFVDYEKEQLWSNPDRTKLPKAEIRLPNNLGVLGYVAQTGKGMNITDAYSDPIFNPKVDERLQGRTQTLLCMPIVSSKAPDKVVAIVQLINKVGDLPFTDEDEQEFRAFSDPIGIILESCQSLYTAARNQKGVAALLKATTSLGQSLNLETTLRTVMDQARDLLKADRSTIFLICNETGELWTKVATADESKMVEIRIPANKGIAGYVASTGEILNIPDAYQDPRFDPSTDRRTGYVTRNILCMPVFNSDAELIGVTQLINKHSGSFSNSDEFFMKAFNIQAGIAIENAKLFEDVSLEKQYQKDILQSLSDAVISTDMQGKIVTINEAALQLIGCPKIPEIEKQHQRLWEGKLIGRPIWEIVRIDSLHFRLKDSLKNAARHYVPEQTLTTAVYVESELNTNGSNPETYILAIPDRTTPDRYIPWGHNIEPATNEDSSDRSISPTQLDEPVDTFPEMPLEIPADKIQKIERSINLTVTPLTNPEGGVRGGLVVLEDISQEKRMKTTMYRYMNPEVAEQVMALGDDALMVGERKDVTILFSDIRGYTTLTEKFGASEVVTLLNQYFETMVEAVFNYQGTLDKFIGDALMAVFGAPLPVEQHAWMAVQSALNMRRRLQEFNLTRAIGTQLLQVGIGISSGEVVSGNIGSRKRMDYTVIGDAVNLSARLESVTKEYGCDIIISHSTYELCSDRIWVRELDKIRVKGKFQAVSIYELIGDRQQALDSETLNFLELYHTGRQHYNNRCFLEAIQSFTAAQKIRPQDQSVSIHLNRCSAYLQNPPPEEWDGVHIMTTK
jgi:adenylate cyclase